MLRIHGGSRLASGSTVRIWQSRPPQRCEHSAVTKPRELHRAGECFVVAPSLLRQGWHGYSVFIVTVLPRGWAERPCRRPRRQRRAPLLPRVKVSSESASTTPIPTRRPCGGSKHRTTQRIWLHKCLFGMPSDGAVTSSGLRSNMFDRRFYDAPLGYF